MENGDELAKRMLAVIAKVLLVLAVVLLCLCSIIAVDGCVRRDLLHEVDSALIRGSDGGRVDSVTVIFTF